VSLVQSDILHWLATHLVRLGPGVLLAICLVETAIFAGLILPVGALIAFAALLSARGVFDPAHVVLAALFGALIGDQLGFLVGRRFVFRARPLDGRIARLWSGALVRTEALVRRHGLLGVTTARAIPFVRTLMPWFAGRSGTSWPRFLLFDLLGVLLWGAIYLGGGLVAGYGWEHMAQRYGEVAALVLLAVGLAAGLLLARRWVRGWVGRVGRMRRGAARRRLERRRFVHGRNQGAESPVHSRPGRDVEEIRPTGGSDATRVARSFRATADPMRGCTG
jgi:membrane-associated protein